MTDVDWHTLFDHPLVQIYGELGRVRVISVDKYKDSIYLIRVETPDKYCAYSTGAYYCDGEAYEMVIFEPAWLDYETPQGTFNLMDDPNKWPITVENYYGLRESHPDYYRDAIYIKIDDAEADDILQIEPMKGEYVIWLCDRHKIYENSSTLEDSRGDGE